MSRQQDLIRYRDALVVGGVAPEPAQEAADSIRREFEALDRGTCPKCTFAVRPDIEERQAGPSMVHGLWVRYHCTGCGYAVTRKEPVDGIGN